MVGIFIKDNRRYKEYIEKNGYKRIRKLCILEKCNNITSVDYCKRHTLTDDDIICENCIKLVKKHDSSGVLCNRCNIKNLRQQEDFTSKILIENGIRYTIYKKAGKRKMCKLKDCPKVSSGEYCRFHNTFEINENQRRCNRCLNVKYITEFTDNFKGCKPCTEYKKNSSLLHHDKRRHFLLQLKISKGGSCIICGTDDLEILEFDHLVDKKREVRKMYNYDDMEKEAEKCQLLCCNCHRKKSKYSKEYKVSSSGYNKRKISRDHVNNIKLNSGGCNGCGWFDKNYLNVLDFDHLNTKDKQYNISVMVGKGLPVKLIDEEVAKTRILCANCHRKHTLRQFNYPILNIIRNLA